MKDFKELPDQERMEEAAELDIFDIEGNKIKFGALFKEQKTIVVFIKATKFSGLFYADPTRKLYRTLGMDIENVDKTPAGEQKRSYLTLGSFSNLMMSLWRGPFKHPTQVGKQGDFAQLGGDFIFGPDVEVTDLVKEAGVMYSSSS
ncbi:hypothetical protein CVT25_010425 [Psilocybe cyanescens]|uniref:Uncharacterized protein n=1 Tax=Psilocybe cyanescens TaxID=93625 RepID=A0A409XP39_PSICY|nr:hypothetical protein CVT25_010425 [Psilocybe cyanescens]